MSDTLTLELQSRPDAFVSGLKAAAVAAEAFRKKILAVQKAVESSVNAINVSASKLSSFGSSLGGSGGVAAAPARFRALAAAAAASAQTVVQTSNTSTKTLISNVAAINAALHREAAALEKVGKAAVSGGGAIGALLNANKTLISSSAAVNAALHKQAEAAARVGSRQGFDSGKTQVSSSAAVNAALNAATQGLPAVSRSLIGFEQVVGNVAKKVERSIFSIRTALLTLGAVSVVQKIVNAGADFQDALGQIAIVANDAGKPIGEFRKELLELSKTTPTGLQDLAKAYATAIGTLPKGAQQAREAKEALVAADQAARASGSTAAENLVGITAVLNTYRKTGITATEITDKLFQTFDQGGATVPQLANSIGQVAGIAATFNININELFGSIAVLTRSGQSASEAITNLRQAYISIARPPEIAAARAKELGIELGEVALRAKGLPGVLRDIENKGGKPFLSQLLTDTQGFLAAGTLLAVGLEVLDDDIVRLSTSSGRTAKAVKTLEGNFSEAAGILRNKLTTVFIAMSEKVMPQLIAAFAKLGEFVVDNQGQIADAFKSAFDAMDSLRKFVIEHGEGILLFFATLFAVGRIATFSTALKQLGVLLTTAMAGPIAGAAATGGMNFAMAFTKNFPKIATALLAVLNNAGLFGAILVIGGAIGYAIINAIKDAVRAGEREAEERAKATIKRINKELGIQAINAGFETDEDLRLAEGQVRRGEMVDTVGRGFASEIKDPRELNAAGDIVELERAFERELIKQTELMLDSEARIKPALARLEAAKTNLASTIAERGADSIISSADDFQPEVFTDKIVADARRKVEIAEKFAAQEEAIFRKAKDNADSIRESRAAIRAETPGTAVEKEESLAKIANIRNGLEEDARKKLGALRDKDDEKKRRKLELEKLLADARLGEGQALYESTARQIEIEQAAFDARGKNVAGLREQMAQAIFDASEGKAVDQARLAVNSDSSDIQERIFNEEKALNARRIGLIEDVKQAKLNALFDETNAEFDELVKHSERVKELTIDEINQIDVIEKAIKAESRAKEAQIDIDSARATQEIILAQQARADEIRIAKAAAAQLRAQLFVEKGLARSRATGESIGRFRGAVTDPLGALTSASERATVEAERARGAAFEKSRASGAEPAAQIAAGSAAFQAAGGTGALASAGPVAAVIAIALEAPAIQNAMSEFLEHGVEDWVHALIKGTPRLWKALLVEFPKQLGRLFMEFFNSAFAQGVGKYILKPIGDFFARLGNAFGDFFSKLYDSLLKGIVEGMVAGAKAAWEFIGEKFIDAINEITDFGSDTADFLTGGDRPTTGNSRRARANREQDVRTNQGLLRDRFRGRRDQFTGNFANSGNLAETVAALLATGMSLEQIAAFLAISLARVQAAAPAQTRHEGGMVRGAGSNARAALGLALSGASAFAFGGLVGAPGDATRVALGRVLGGDDVPMIGQAGEGVINRRGMADIGEDGLARINRGQGAGGPAQVSVNLGGRRDIKALMSLILGEVSVDIASPSGQVRRAVTKTQRAPIMTTFVRRT